MDSAHESPVDSPSESRSDSELLDGAPKVLWLILDGVRTDEISLSSLSALTGKTGEAHCPAIWGSLVAAGTVLRSIYNPGYTDTAPAHVAMFSGRTEVYANASVTTDQASLYLGTTPNLFQQAVFAGVPAVFLGDASLLRDAGGTLYPPIFADPYQYTDNFDDAAVISQIQAVITADTTQLIVANLHLTDQLGHQGYAADYAAGVQTLDAQVAALYRWLQTSAWADALVVVSTDHGRHRENASDPPWQNHGDSCAGCRELPLFVAGPGIPAGVEVEGPYLSSDISTLVSDWLSIDLPFARGLPIEGLPLGQSRSGSVGLQMAGGHRIWQQFSQDPAHRSSILVDGIPLSDPEALLAEAPALAVGEGWMAACWRELHLTEGTTLPWQPRCMVAIGEAPWQALDVPLEIVDPASTPALAITGQTLHLAWLVQLEQSGVVIEQIRLPYWSEAEGWGEDIPYYYDFPVFPVLATEGEQWALMFAATPGGMDLRDERRIFWFMDGRTGEVEVADPLGVLPARVEQTSLRIEGGVLKMAALLIGDGFSVVVTSESSDHGLRWSVPAVLPGREKILPYLPPHWLGEEVVWAVAFDDQEVGLCRAGAGDLDARCERQGTYWLDSWGIEGNAAVGAVRDGDRVWQIQTLVLPE